MRLACVCLKSCSVLGGAKSTSVFPFVCLGSFFTWPLLSLSLLCLPCDNTPSIPRNSLQACNMRQNCLRLFATLPIHQPTCLPACPAVELPAKQTCRNSELAKLHAALAETRSYANGLGWCDLHWLSGVTGGLESDEEAHEGTCS